MPISSVPVGSTPRPASARPRSEVFAGFKDSVPVGLGLFPMGLAFGILITHSGLPWWSAPMFSAVMYTGTLEFLLIPMLLAAAPLVTIALTTLLVNGRHAFYALSFPLHRVQGRWARLYSTFALSDEAYAVTTGGQARTWSSVRIVSFQAFNHAYCVAGALVGALVGSLIPPRITGLDFAMTALLVVLALDAIRERRHDLPTPILALLAALIARMVTPGQMLLTAFGLFTTALLIRHFTARPEPARA
ncbi:AzlC family ABC transporter permease [Streptomyces albidoflavus]|uniref:AzlC family ABC transporter permease n=1 Tax=Streptomyces albidoflavus TaxID=1886 RepID=UPI00101E2B59|nr:AzlC family ABC transporter permease [Streptomyces albidoflavus]RZD82212.1 branched-chain amino acid ABC transporter permease [Streptomyces albidoflavus]